MKSLLSKDKRPYAKPLLKLHGNVAALTKSWDGTGIRYDALNGGPTETKTGANDGMGAFEFGP